MNLPPPNLFALWAHPAMLAWLAAASAPLIIHLLSRRRYREVPWAAMHYLLAAMRKNSRRIRIEQWLLLAVRTLLVAAVVLAVAEPVVERTGLLVRSGQPTHKILVLDASYSMSYRPTDRTRFDRAKQLAQQIVEASSQGDGFTLLLLADPPQVVVATPSFAAADFNAEIANLKPLEGGGDLAATLAQVERVRQMARRDYPRLEREEILVLTDMGRTSWAPELSAAAQADFRRQSQRLGAQSALTVIDLGQPAGDNLAIEQLRLSEPCAVVGQETLVQGEVRNFGHQPRPDARVELFVDGRRTAEARVDLPAGGRASISVPHRFDAAGDRAVELRLATDPLDLDNHRYLAVPVKNEIRVLCVDGRPAAAGFQAATAYLAVALAPPSDKRQRARVRVDVLPDSALLDTDLTRFECVFLCDVPQFTPREAKVLRNYLNGGGSLVFFLGARVMPESYNRQLARTAEDEGRVLPAALESIVEVSGVGLDPRGYAHPLVAPFRDAEQAGLLTTPVSKYYRLAVPQETRAKVALALDNGDPLIVEEPLGRGRATIVATSADTSWTAMPVWPSYLPIVQELLALSLAGQTRDRNVLVGETLAGVLPQSAAVNVDVRAPSGEVQRATVVNEGSANFWNFSETAASGIYVAEVGPDVPLGGFAVNLNTVESDLSRVDETELADSIWPGVPHVLRTHWQQGESDAEATIVSRSHLHQYLLAAALALLVSESLLAWYMGRHAA